MKINPYQSFIYMTAEERRIELCLHKKIRRDNEFENDVNKVEKRHNFSNTKNQFPCAELEKREKRLEMRSTVALSRIMISCRKRGGIIKRSGISFKYSCLKSCRSKNFPLDTELCLKTEDMTKKQESRVDEHFHDKSELTVEYKGTDYQKLKGTKGQKLKGRKVTLENKSMEYKEIDYQKLNERKVILENKETDCPILKGRKMILENKETSCQKLNGMKVILKNNKIDCQILKGRKLILENKENNCQKLKERKLILENKEIDSQKLKGRKVILENKSFGDVRHKHCCHNPAKKSSTCNYKLVGISRIFAWIRSLFLLSLLPHFVLSSEFPDRECCDSAPPPPPLFHPTSPVPFLGGKYPVYEPTHSPISTNGDQNTYIAGVPGGYKTPDQYGEDLNIPKSYYPWFSSAENDITNPAPPEVMGGGDIGVSWPFGSPNPYAGFDLIDDRGNGLDLLDRKGLRVPSYEPMPGV